MKRAILTCLAVLACISQFSQKLADDLKLKEYRKGLGWINELMQNGIMKEEVSGLEYFTGYEYKTLYDWDQQENGFIARSVPSNEWHDAEHVKPFLSQIALLVYRAYGELDWITTEVYFPRLQKYLDYWLNDMDDNKNGLSEWMSAPHTGMDNQHERAGFWGDRNCEGVDLNSYLVRECRAFARLAELAGRENLANQYRLLAEQRKSRINELLWDERDGFYYDRKKDRDRPLAASLWEGAMLNVQSAGQWKIPVRSVAAFTTIWAGVASESQANAMVTRYLTNPREFWTPYPVAALSKSEIWYSTTKHPGVMGCSWRANTWIPTNYMIYHGLKWYGYDGIATSLARRTVELLEKSGDREYYNTETGEGVGLDPFWGWSLLGHFFMLEEELVWDINNINTGNP